MQTLNNWYTSASLLIGYPDDEPNSVVLDLDNLMHSLSEPEQGSVLIFPERIYKLGKHRSIVYSCPSLNTAVDTTPGRDRDVQNWADWTTEGGDDSW